MMVGNALISIYEFGKKNSKVILAIAVIAVLALAGYAQFNHAKLLIDSKKESYLPVKEAAIWMKDNSYPEDRIVTVSYPQTVYYSERNVTLLSNIKNATELDEFIKNNKPKFIELSMFEYHNPWVYSWPTTNNYTDAVKMYFADAQKTQPLLIVYRFRDS
jgi:hypothetical protein